MSYRQAQEQQEEQEWIAELAWRVKEDVLLAQQEKNDERLRETANSTN